ncbi:ribonuclease domain-containing protein [Nocardioides currus]|uniref:Ribonuclease n=1 Tax=Nocardioides currus TaxID=2133958 RepID=A0A2R7YW33_9ACTN|nr:ribonuclease domain-containing protein [Nocardioides currus]PUA80578.1 ribonuclease [Nocardioides currus]
MRVTAQRRVLATVVALLVLVALWWVQQQSDPADADRARDSSPSAQSSTGGDPDGDPDGDPGTDPDSGLPFVDVADLPAEAVETLELIDDGGPFPYDRDGVTFENREGILPDRQRGYYHEYTVPTPGSDDRGARRIVTGSSDEFFWTADHYSSFSRIAR